MNKDELAAAIGMEAPDQEEVPEKEQENEKDDPISSAFFDILTDEGMDFLWDIVGDMIDNEEIEEVPSEEASEQEQQDWLDKNMGKIRERFKEELGGDTSLEPADG